jgi:hypothetical protein
MRFLLVFGPKKVEIFRAHPFRATPSGPPLQGHPFQWPEYRIGFSCIKIIKSNTVISKTFESIIVSQDGVLCAIK